MMKHTWETSFSVSNPTLEALPVPNVAFREGTLPALSRCKEGRLCDICHGAGIRVVCGPEDPGLPWMGSRVGKASCPCGEGRLLAGVDLLMTPCGWWLFVVRSCSDGFLDKQQCH